MLRLTDIIYDYLLLARANTNKSGKQYLIFQISQINYRSHALRGNDYSPNKVSYLVPAQLVW